MKNKDSKPKKKKKQSRSSIVSFIIIICGISVRKKFFFVHSKLSIFFRREKNPNILILNSNEFHTHANKNPNDHHQKLL